MDGPAPATPNRTSKEHTMALGHYISGLQKHIKELEGPTIAGIQTQDDRTRDYLFDLANLLESLDGLTGEPGSVPRETVREVVWDTLDLDGAEQ